MRQRVAVMDLADRDTDLVALCDGLDEAQALMRTEDYEHYEPYYFVFQSDFATPALVFDVAKCDVVSPLGPLVGIFESHDAAIDFCGDALGEWQVFS